jgi:hypothetical protein
MNNLQFEKVYDLSVLVYTDMQLHPAEEAAGARAFTNDTICLKVRLPSIAGDLRA